ncbi:MAG: hypothetical protein HYR48_03240, partial [Gemmatimonadetes bacterium]|nr:hypothetical protein [Gemmatimonadota bacterium]
REEWLMMGDMMGGIEAMGGPATGILRSAARDSTAAPAPAHQGHRRP